jgi:hypothetical protein
MSSGDEVLAFGPPALTQYAADCAIDVIDFMAAVVRGVDLIDVTPEMRRLWRNYLAQYYPMLAPADRFWFANAPATLAQINATWPQMPQFTREMWRQNWAISLPAVLQFIEPVLQTARQQQLWHAAHLSNYSRQPPSTASYSPAPPASSYSPPPQTAKPAQAVHNQQQIADNLAAFNNRMSFLTTNLMRAYSGH